MAGVGGVVGGEWRQLYLNNNKKKILRILDDSQKGRWGQVEVGQLE